jgi:short-subunit dehydrogenase involved in D-alanine esterification of teichoic acids
MAIESGQVLTPAKTVSLIEEIKMELQDITTTIASGKYSDSIVDVMNKSKDSLQSILNMLINKKGVVTPSETTDVLDVLNNAKRQRLQDDYIIGMKSGTFYVLSFLIIAGVSYYLIKNSK